jgi:hypothetical protein
MHRALYKRKYTYQKKYPQKFRISRPRNTSRSWHHVHEEWTFIYRLNIWGEKLQQK